MNIIFLISLLVIAVAPASSIFLQNELKNISRRVELSPAEWTEPEGLWSSLLQEWTISNKDNPPRGREARVFQTVAPPNFANRYIPTSEAYLTRRIGEAVELEPNLRRPQETMGKVMSPPQQMMPQYQPQQRQQYQFNSPREVSETDLYLLGAIEKLVYRVDYMEKRLRRTEQMLYYLMAGNNQKIEPSPCSTNFTKIGKDCYYFGVRERVDWKNAAQQCKSLGGYLAEFEKVEHYQDVAAHILSHQEYRGHDFWLGALNPGLLWIWSTSAKPVQPNTNLTAIGNKSETTTKIPLKISNTTQNVKKNETTLTSNFPEITGNGRCLRLSYNPTLFNYGYTGQECSSKQHFLCVKPDKSLDNEINRLTRNLNIDVDLN